MKIFFKKLVRSFKCAFTGLYYLIKYERNFKVHLAIFSIMIVLGFLFKFSYLEFIIVLVVSGMVMATEAINSGFEIILDIIYPEHNSKSRIIKDILAGAVLVTAIIAAIVGVLLFVNHFN
jgi:diacylglycerol kinase